MTLENVKAGDVIKCNEDRYDYLVYGFSYKVHKDDDGLFIYDEFRRKVGLDQLSLDKFQLLSAPESQAHLLTEKDSNDMAHVSEHLSAIEYLRQPSLKELSQPPVMEGKATFEKSERFIQILKEGNEGHEFREVIDGLMNEQILECIEQYKNEHISSLQSEVEQLKGLLKEIKNRADAISDSSNPVYIKQASEIIAEKISNYLSK